MDHILDTSGLFCPYPLAKTKRFIKKIKPGETLKVVSTDPASLIDFKVFAETTCDVELVEQHYDKNQQQYVFILMKR